MCQDIAKSLDKGGGINAIIIDFSKAFDLDAQDRLLTKLAASGMDSKVIVWVREFLVCRTLRVKVEGGGQLCKEGKVTPGVPQESVLGPLLLLVYVNYIFFLEYRLEYKDVIIVKFVYCSTQQISNMCYILMGRMRDCSTTASSAKL